jgi:urea transport system substrate-binding protein
MALAIIAASSGLFYALFARKSSVKIGILHSLSGSQAISEKPMVDAELMAIEEINAQKKFLKYTIVPVIADGKSDEAVFAHEAERLITQEKVSAIIGCWTSASRKAVKDVVEKHNNLLIYPVSYEGIEDSPNILYLGANQNQQIVPSVLWSFLNLGKRFFLVGSDYIYSHVAHEIIKKVLNAVKGTVLGEEYILLGSSDINLMVQAIVNAKPDVIINTIQGESNIAFFNALRAANITPETIPVMSISSMSETEFVHIGNDAMSGDYVTASYFQSIDREENIQFVERFRKKYGNNRVISEAVETAYNGIYIWAQALSVAQSYNPEIVKKHLFNKVFNAPSGIVYTDSNTLDLWKMIYVGKLRSDGQFTIVWDSKKQVQPFNYPVFSDKAVWNTFVTNLYESWGRAWSRTAR